MYKHWSGVEKKAPSVRFPLFIPNSAYLKKRLVLIAKFPGRTLNSSYPHGCTLTTLFVYSASEFLTHSNKRPGMIHI